MNTFDSIETADLLQVVSKTPVDYYLVIGMPDTER